MVEYASVRSSLYDIDSLVSQLNERSGDGWEVVQILPTGGDVTAVLRRSDEPVAEAGADDTAGVAAVVAVDEEAAAIDAGDVARRSVVEEIVADPVTEEPVVEEIVVGRGAVAVEEPVVEEPAGWAAAPVVADAVAEPETTADEAPAARSAGDTSTYAPVAEETPAPEPEPVAAAAAVAAEPAPAPAPPSPPPAPGRSQPSRRAGTPIRRAASSCATGTATPGPSTSARQGQMYTDPPVA